MERGGGLDQILARKDYVIVDNTALYPNCESDAEYLDRMAAYIREYPSFHVTDACSEEYRQGRIERGKIMFSRSMQERIIRIRDELAGRQRVLKLEAESAGVKEYAAEHLDLSIFSRADVSNIVYTLYLALGGRNCALVTGEKRIVTGLTKLKHLRYALGRVRIIDIVSQEMHGQRRFYLNNNQTQRYKEIERLKKEESEQALALLSFQKSQRTAS